MRVLQREKAREELLKQFYDHYLPVLHDWCVRRADKVRACYLGVPTPHGLTKFIVGSEAYDFDLGEEFRASPLNSKSRVGRRASCRFRTEQRKTC